jgi:Flp pilus assembly protein TadB
MEADQGGAMAVTQREELKALKADAYRMRDALRKDNLEERVEGAVEERPGIRPFLEFRPLLLAVAIAAVVTLIAALIASPGIAGIVLLLSFAIAWVAMSRREYSKRTPTKEFSPDDEDSPGKGDKEVAPYSS